MSALDKWKSLFCSTCENKTKHTIWTDKLIYLYSGNFLEEKTYLDVQTHADVNDDGSVGSSTAKMCEITQKTSLGFNNASSSSDSHISPQTQIDNNLHTSAQSETGHFFNRCSLRTKLLKPISMLKTFLQTFSDCLIFKISGNQCEVKIYTSNHCFYGGDILYDS